MTLRLSTPAAEGVYQGSKYLKFQVLCDAEELQKLLDGSFAIYPLTGLRDGEPIKSERLIEAYASWIEGLKEGREPTDESLREVLAAAFTAEGDALWKQAVAGDRFIVKIAKPVVQVQAHFFTYSPIDGVFRPMSMGPGNIFWGLQFSFPQIYQDAKTMEFFEVDECPNAELFQRIRQWVRDTTRATPFVVGGKRVNVPIRLGKQCFSWIHRHPKLIEQKIEVYAG
jgi:hypothetical protein